MKSLVITTAIFIFLSISGLNAKANGIVKETENFTISTNDNFDQSHVAQKSWTIAYGDQDKKIEVYKNQLKNGEEYIVRNKFFEVRYVNNQNGFGVKKIRNSQMQVDAMINSAVVNTDALHDQSLLSPVQLEEEKALNYIASFVPFLLNENYKHLLN